MPDGGRALDKADPFALYAEQPPSTSRAWVLDDKWGDDAWMASRRRGNAFDYFL
jgi:1,4-alpha-glucan branching enzyme